MALTEVHKPLGAPWAPALAGTLETFVVESDALRGNPLGDPARRPLYVYRSPNIRTAAETDIPEVYDVPSIYVLQAFGGQADKWLARQSFEPTLIERLDGLFGATDTPDAVIVFVDAWTSLGGSQFLNSPATGRYLDYLCDEVVPFIDKRYPTDPRRRGLTGHSSGGYGATVVPMLRPGLFAGFSSHAGDALFEYCYMPSIAAAARALRDRFDGSLAHFRADFASRERFDYGRFGALLEVCAYAAAYSPDLAGSGEFLLPFSSLTARLDAQVWERWLEHDPVRMAPAHADALRALRWIRLEAGRRDEASLDLGAQALSAELAALGITHTFELFDGGHTGLAHRYPSAIAELIRALAS